MVLLRTEVFHSPTPYSLFTKSAVEVHHPVKPVANVGRTVDVETELTAQRASDPKIEAEGEMAK